MKKPFQNIVLLTLLTVHTSARETPQLVPQNVIAEFAKEYSKDELLSMQRDEWIIKDLCFDKVKALQNPTYLATCGGLARANPQFWKHICMNMPRILKKKE